MIEQTSGFLVFALFSGLLWARPHLQAAIARLMPPGPSTPPGFRCRSTGAPTDRLPAA